MRNWKAYYAEEDRKEKERIKKQEKEIADTQRQLSRSAPSQRTGSLFSNLFSGSHSGSEVRRPALVPARAGSELRLERDVEELRSQIGLISEVLHGIDRNVEHNQQANLDRFDGLKAQITRENRRLMTAIGTIRYESDCELSDPTTYIHCISLIYLLIFRIFKFLCELVFVVGNSFKGFLGIMPFPFSLLVFIAYIFEMILIFIIFDTTIMVSTVGISHIEFISHNALFGHYNGAPEFMTPRDVMYQGLFRSGLFVLSQILVLLGSAYELVLGRDIAMIQRETARYISS